MMYRYETHLHTSEGSACGSISGAEQARRYHELGYQGIIITDHFFTGNCAVPRELPWKEWARQFCLGYVNAKKAGDEIGLDVFFGWESNYHGAEFLIYGLSPEWLEEHPEVLDWSVEQQFENVSKAGGMVIQAHPFREDWYIDQVRVYPHAVHGVEVFNVGNEFRNPIYNDRALAYAMEHKLPMIAGTDSHGYNEHNVGIACDRRLEAIQDFIALVKSGTGYELIP